MHDFLLAKIFLFKEYLALDFGSLQVREVSVFYNRNARNRIKINPRFNCSPKALPSLRSRSLYHCSNSHAIALSLLLKLSISTVELTAHKGVNISYILFIIVHKFISVKYKLCVTKCKELVQICVSYVIIIAERLHARKDNKTQAHLQTNRSK